MQRREQTTDAVDRAEAILLASGAVSQHGGQNRAFYRLRTDSINFATMASFPPPTTVTRLHCTNSGTGLATPRASVWQRGLRQ
jgi:antirestriction protein ArdC